MVEADRMRWSTNRRRGVGLAGALVLLKCASGCQGPNSHVLLGQLYEANRGCIDPTTSIDIVDGPDPGSGCSATCVVIPLGQNGGRAGVYVTTMCGPYPVLDDTTGTPAGCAEALAALDRGDVCAADGTSASPADAGPSDASPPDASAPDASPADDSGSGDAAPE